MKYCSSCGQSLEENDVFCRHCGKAFDASAKTNDTGSPGWGVLGFLFPIVGLILYLVWRNEQPKNAKSAGLGALVNVIIGAVSLVIFFVIFFIIMAIAL